MSSERTTIFLLADVDEMTGSQTQSRGPGREHSQPR